MNRVAAQKGICSIESSPIATLGEDIKLDILEEFLVAPLVALHQNQRGNHCVYGSIWPAFSL
ncbi:MAG: hypothetical protein ACTSO3_15950 [Candidatus Heimdallarchaeaceae archaeon]